MIFWKPCFGNPDENYFASFFSRIVLYLTKVPFEFATNIAFCATVHV